MPSELPNRAMIQKPLHLQTPESQKVREHTSTGFEFLLQHLSDLSMSRID